MEVWRYNPSDGTDTLYGTYATEDEAREARDLENLEGDSVFYLKLT